MKNPWVKYLVLRIGTFSVFLAVFLLLQFDPFYAAAIAAILALKLTSFGALAYALLLAYGLAAVSVG